MNETVCLAWRLDMESESIQAPSIYCGMDDDEMFYSVEQKDADTPEWEAYFDGYPLAKGSLQDCIAACVQSELDASTIQEEQEVNRRS